MSARARYAVFGSFFLNGLGLATWLSRVPEARESLHLSNGQLGLLLLVIAGGSVLTLPTSGALINRWGVQRVVRVGIVCAVVGMAGSAVGAALLTSVTVTAVFLFLYGLGVGTWDVGMNVEGADVERRLGRTIMPRFHAGFSLGTVVAAGIGAVTIWAGVGMVPHLVLGSIFMLLVAYPTTGWFVSPRSQIESTGEATGNRVAAWRAWMEPRTLLIGVMVFALALAEGTANDWLALALIDGYDAPRWLGVAGFAAFVSAMTFGRLVGPLVLDRYGRVTVLLTTMAAAALGVLLLVFGGHVVLAGVGIMVWGLGASLGFPVGMSAAADDPQEAAARVSVVATIAYTAFLSGPPLLGFLADRVGTLHALLVVAALLAPSALVVPATRRQEQRTG